VAGSRTVPGHTASPSMAPTAHPTLFDHGVWSKGSGPACGPPPANHRRRLTPGARSNPLIRKGSIIMPRRKRLNQGGLVYHVLNRAAARRRIFDSQQDYLVFERSLEQARLRINMRILTYCVMPNHWHLVLWPWHDGDLSRFMKWLGTTHSRRWQVAHQSTGCGPVYQGRFKSFPIELGGHLLTVCRYVERNPLRADLVGRAQEWRWSGLSQRLNENETVELARWPVRAGADWVEYVNCPQTEAELAAVRTSIRLDQSFGCIEG
jgi:putative transposase